LVHTVQPKETLFSISKHYGIPIDKLKSFNNLTDNNLSVGQRLKIPLLNGTDHNKVTKEIKETKEQEPQVKETPKGNIPEFHIVQPGETLYRIHVKYNISIKKLKELNGLKDNTIRVGQKIRLR
jgi:LysM repeat protein